MNSWAAVVVAAVMLLVGAREADALDRRVRIVNDSRHDIVAFYGAVVTERDWPGSMLGENRLLAGASIVLNFEDESGFCRYRFRAVFDDGMELVRPSVNICEIGTYRYTD
jgi:hypothetical protein